MRTPLEQLWYDILTEAGIQFQEQVDVGPYQADFIIGKIDLEIDGLQHRLDKKHCIHDRKRDEFFIESGYKVVRIPMNYHNLNRKKHQEKFHKQIDDVLDLISGEFA